MLCGFGDAAPVERAVAGKQSVGVEGGEVFDGAPVGGGVVLERAVQALRSGDAGDLVTADKGVTGHQPLAAGDEVGAVTIGMSVCGNGFGRTWQIERAGLAESYSVETFAAEHAERGHPAQPPQHQRPIA